MAKLKKNAQVVMVGKKNVTNVEGLVLFYGVIRKHNVGAVEEKGMKNVSFAAEKVLH